MTAVVLRIPRVLSRLIRWPGLTRPAPIPNPAEWDNLQQDNADHFVNTEIESLSSQIWLNQDVLLKLASYLDTLHDRIALAQVCRWHYLVLRYTPYAHLALTQDVRLDYLVAQLSEDEMRSNSILHLDILFPSLWKPALAQENEHCSRESFFIENVFHVLKLCRRLKSLRIHNTRCGYVRWETLSNYMHDSYPFSLKLLSLTQSVDGTIGFVRDQTQLLQLVLFSSAKAGRIDDPDPEREPPLPPIVLPYLKTLWATPWWCQHILLHCSVEYFGLLHDGSRANERHILRKLINTLVNEGGHPTVNCLGLSYEDFLWDHQTVGLEQYGAAFPHTKKLCVTLPGIGSNRIENIESCLNYVQQLSEKYSVCPLPSLKELVFLRSGDYWPNPYNEPYQIEQMGRCFVIELLLALGKLFPRLDHVDFLNNCFRRTPEGDSWNGRIRRCCH